MLSMQSLLLSTLFYHYNCWVSIESRKIVSNPIDVPINWSKFLTDMRTKNHIYGQEPQKLWNRIVNVIGQLFPINGTFVQTHRAKTNAPNCYLYYTYCVPRTEKKFVSLLVNVHCGIYHYRYCCCCCSWCW